MREDDDTPALHSRKMTKQQNAIPTALMWSSALLLLAFHVHAETNSNSSDHNSLFDRIQAGPQHLTGLDMILVGSLLMLGLEVVDFGTSNSGSE